MTKNSQEEPEEKENEENQDTQNRYVPPEVEWTDLVRNRAQQKTSFETSSRVEEPNLPQASNRNGNRNGKVDQGNAPATTNDMSQRQTRSKGPAPTLPNVMRSVLEQSPQLQREMTELINRRQ